jgi:predicted metalloendopeptidase
MPGTNFTSEQTFFLAYAQTQCYKRVELLQLVRTQLGVYDERTALNAALAHMPEFAEAFQCRKRDNTCF